MHSCHVRRHVARICDVTAQPELVICRESNVGTTQHLTETSATPKSSAMRPSAACAHLQRLMRMSTVHQDVYCLPGCLLLAADGGTADARDLLGPHPPLSPVDRDTSISRASQLSTARGIKSLVCNFMNAYVDAL